MPKRPQTIPEYIDTIPDLIRYFNEVITELSDYVEEIQGIDDKTPKIHNNLNMTQNRIVSVASPSATEDAANKAYVDALVRSFKTINCPAGTDPVADRADDTLNLLSGSSSLTITGDAATDTITFTIAGGVMKEQIFLADDTWVCPADDTYVEVICVGGGGGGGGGGAAGAGDGGAGEDSLFGILATGAGGTGGAKNGGAPGTGYNTGQQAALLCPTTGGIGGQGGMGFNGFGHGGHGGESRSNTPGTSPGSGGGSGSPAFYTDITSDDQAITVGAGGAAGAAGASGSAGQVGSAGVVIVRWLESV